MVGIVEFMPPKPEPAKRIVIRSQSKATTQVAQAQTDTEFCKFVPIQHTHRLSWMMTKRRNLKNLFKEFIYAVRADIGKGLHTQYT